LPRFKVKQTKSETHNINSTECEITVYAPRTCSDEFVPPVIFGHNLRKIFDLLLTIHNQHFGSSTKTNEAARISKVLEE
jgi:hypothetical protein